MSSTRLPFLRSTVIALALAGGPALAQDTAPASKAPAETEPATPALPEMPRLDIGTSTGLNNPAGMYGIETDFRLLDRVSVGILGGNGAWGIRLTPQARLYPFGVSRAGLFLEAGMSLNFGGMTYLESGDYRLVFHPPSPFFRRVELEVRLEEGHYHVPLLVSPYGCASYRGS